MKTLQSTHGGGSAGISTSASTPDNGDGGSLGIRETMTAGREGWTDIEREGVGGSRQAEFGDSGTQVARATETV